VVDLRTVSFDVPPQEILTKDSVTVAVDAVVYYKVKDAVTVAVNAVVCYMVKGA
jgi:erythrocyte band 7 integral membrane protein